MAVGHFVILLTIASLLTGTHALWCYACGATGKDNRCEHYSTYQEAELSDGNKTGILKQCIPPHDKICFIETWSSQGTTHSHIRDCNDGYTFSFENGTYSRLDGLGNDNETACVWKEDNLICLSKCNTDFCNGPFPSELSFFDVNMAAPTRWSVTLMVTCFVLYVSGTQREVEV